MDGHTTSGTGAAVIVILGLCCIIRSNISGAVLPYSDLQVIAKSQLRGVQYSQPIFT